MAYLAVVIRSEGRAERLLWRAEHPSDPAECTVEGCPCRVTRALPPMEVLFAGCGPGQWLTTDELVKRAGAHWTPQALGPLLTAAGCERYRTNFERGWRPPVGLEPMSLEQALTASGTRASGDAAAGAWEKARPYRPQAR